MLTCCHPRRLVDQQQRHFGKSPLVGVGEGAFQMLVPDVRFSPQGSVELSEVARHHSPAPCPKIRSIEKDLPPEKLLAIKTSPVMF